MSFGAHGAGLLEELAFHAYAPFTAAVHIGTPPQRLQLLLDTGSAITWVFGGNCSGCDAGSPRYGARESSSAALVSPRFALQLLHGSGLAGRVVRDTVALGPLEVTAQPLAVVEQILEARSQQKAKAEDEDSDAQGGSPTLALQQAQQSGDGCYGGRWMRSLQPCELRRSRLLLQAGASGVLGMGRSSIAGREPGEPPALFDSLVLQGALPDDVFTLDMAALAGRSGSMHLGGVPAATAYSGRLRYYNCSSASSWRLSFEGVHVRQRPPPGSWQRMSRGQYMTHVCLEGGRCEATLASGSAFIVGPASSVQTLLLEVQVDTDCRGIETLPSVYFRILGHDFEVSPSEYVLRLQHHGRTQCVAAFLPHRDDGNRRDWLLGAPFFRRHVVVFDRRKHRVGIAEKRSVTSDRGGAPDDSPEVEMLTASASETEVEL